MNYISFLQCNAFVTLHFYPTVSTSHTFVPVNQMLYELSKIKRPCCQRTHPDFNYCLSRGFYYLALFRLQNCKNQNGTEHRYRINNPKKY